MRFQGKTTNKRKLDLLALQGVTLPSVITQAKKEVEQRLVLDSKLRFFEGQ